MKNVLVAHSAPNLVLLITLQCQIISHNGVRIAHLVSHVITSARCMLSNMERQQDIKNNINPINDPK